MCRSYIQSFVAFQLGREVETKADLINILISNTFLNMKRSFNFSNVSSEDFEDTGKASLSQGNTQEDEHLSKKAANAWNPSYQRSSTPSSFRNTGKHGGVTGAFVPLSAAQFASELRRKPLTSTSSKVC